MTNRGFPGWLFTSLALVVTCALALYIRIVPPYHTVFDGQWIKLTGVDAYFNMRLVDNLLPNFPRLFSFDPYLLFPGGYSLTNLPAFFVYLVAGTARLLVGGTPSQQMYDNVAVYVPAVLGVLAVIPTYFIGRALINRWAGVVAAAALAVAPGELLQRSMLGFVDHHVAEVLFSTCFIAFLILSVKHGREFTYRMIRDGQLMQAGRHMGYSIAAGIFMGLYLITWQGAPLFIFIIFMCFVIQFISDHLRGLPTDYLSMTAVTCFLMALLIYVPVFRDKLTLLSLGAAILAPIALNVVSAVMAARKMRPAYYLAAVGLMGIAAMLLIWLLSPDSLGTAASYASDMFLWGRKQSVVSEMQPLFQPLLGGPFTLDTAWNQYGLLLYSGLAGLALLIYSSIRKGAPEHIFAATWMVLMMLLAFAMVRFQYYFVVCTAAATGYLAGWPIQAVASHTAPDDAAAQPKKPKRERARERRTATGRALITLYILLGAIVVLAPGTALAVSQAANPAFAPANGWMEALTWLRADSPEPFGSADYYYALYSKPEPGKYMCPRDAYGVLAWWDYGYWITRVGRRVPFSNPATAAINGEAKFFLARDETAAEQFLKDINIRYVMVDYDIAYSEGKFAAMAVWAGHTYQDYYDVYLQQQGQSYVPTLVFYPDYYQTMVVRLYNFGGKEVIPTEVHVIGYENVTGKDDNQYKVITEVKKFSSYQEATQYLSGQEPGTHRIAGLNAYASPVPLEALNRYKPVYDSAETKKDGPVTMPLVRIFQRVP